MKLLGVAIFLLVLEPIHAGINVEEKLERIIAELERVNAENLHLKEIITAFQVSKISSEERSTSKTILQNIHWAEH